MPRLGFDEDPDHPETPYDEQRQPSRPGAALAIEMLNLALADLSVATDRNRYLARRFFTDPESSFPLWCYILDLNPATIREAVARRLNAGHRWTKPGRGGRRAA